MAQVGTLNSFTANTLMRSAEVDENYTDLKSAHNGARFPMFGILLSGLGAGLTRYMAFGSSGFQSDEDDRGMGPVPVALTLSKLTVRLSAIQPASGSLVVTVRKNGVDTALTLTVAAGGSAGTHEDASNSVEFAAGDRLSISVVNNAASTSPLTSWALLFQMPQIGTLVDFDPSTKVNAADIVANDEDVRDNHDAGRFPIITMGQLTSASLYWGPGFVAKASTELPAAWVAPCAGVISDLAVFWPVEDAITWTIYVNGVASSITVTGANSGGVAVQRDNSHSAVIAAGDRIVLVSSAAGAAERGWAFCFRALATGALVTHTAGETRAAADVNANFTALKTAHNSTRVPICFFQSDATGLFRVSAATTSFLGPSLSSGLQATEANAEVICPVATTARNLAVRIKNNAQPGTGSLVFTLRVNGSDTALTVTFAAGALANTTQVDSSNSVAIAAGDRLSLKAVNNASGASADIGAASISLDL